VSATRDELYWALEATYSHGDSKGKEMLKSAIDELAALKEQLRWRTPDEEPDWSNAGQYGELHLEMQFGNRSATEIMIYDKEDFNDNPCTVWRPALPGPEEVG